MINETLRKNINVDKDNLFSIFSFKEGDSAILKLALFKNSAEFDITGQTVRLGAKTKNGLIEQIDGFTISKNNLDIKLKNSILVPGKIEIDLEMEDAKGTMTTASFFITVNQKVLNDEAVEATNEFDTFTKTVDKIESDYTGLRRIIIDENQAASLQDQINNVNSSLENMKINTECIEINLLEKGVVVDEITKATDNTNIIKNVMNEMRQKNYVGVLKLPKGVIYIDDEIVINSDTTIIGGGVNSTTIKQISNKTALSCKSSIGGSYRIQIKDLCVEGSATNGDGLYLEGDSSMLGFLNLENVLVDGFRNGIVIKRPMLCTIDRVFSRYNKNDGIQILGDGTSINATSCWAFQNGGNGWYITDVSYSSFISCASDGNAKKGWYFKGSTNTPITNTSIYSSGSEENEEESYLFEHCWGFNAVGIADSSKQQVYNRDTIKLFGVRNFNLIGINLGKVPPEGYYTLNIAKDLDGVTAYPQNVNLLGCSFGSIGGLKNYVNESTSLTSMTIKQKTSDSYNSNNLSFNFNNSSCNVWGQQRGTRPTLNIGFKDLEFTTADSGITLQSPNGTRYRIKISDDGTISSTKV